MRTIYWLFAVSVALFVSGIGFVIAAGAGPKTADKPADRPPAVPVASVRQIMSSMVNPAARHVFASVGTIISAAGAEERAPKTEEEWRDVGNSAAMLAESANLLMMEGRAVDNNEWRKISKDMADASVVALKAIEARNKDALFDSCETIYASCNTCHEKYQR